MQNPEELIMVVQVVSVVLIWMTLRYAVLKGPLSLLDKFCAFMIGLWAGKGVVLFYQHPTIEFWKEMSPLFSGMYAVSVLWVALSVILLLYLPFKGWLKKS